MLQLIERTYLSATGKDKLVNSQQIVPVDTLILSNIIRRAPYARIYHDPPWDIRLWIQRFVARCTPSRNEVRPSVGKPDSAANGNDDVRRCGRMQRYKIISKDAIRDRELTITREL